MRSARATPAPWLALCTLLSLPAPARAAVADPGSNEAITATPAPAEAPAPDARDPAFDDPAASPLLDRHYRAADRHRAPPLLPPPAREVFTRRFEIIHASGVRPGMRVARIGVGDGLLAALFARAVGPEGVVYGVDSAPGRLADLARIVKEYRVPNLIPTLAAAPDLGLPAAGIDLAFVGGDTPGFTHQGALLDALRGALVPYGTLIVVAPRPRPDQAPPRSGPAAPTGRATLIAAARQAGFRLVDEPGFLREHDVLRFEKSDDEPAPAAPPAPTATPAAPAATTDAR